MKILLENTKKELLNINKYVVKTLSNTTIKALSSDILKGKEKEDFTTLLKKAIEKLNNSDFIITYSINSQNAINFKKQLDKKSIKIDNKKAYEYNINITNALNNKDSIYNEILTNILHLIGYFMGYKTTTNNGTLNNKYFACICEALGYTTTLEKGNKQVNYKLDKVVNNDVVYTPINIKINDIVKAKKQDKKQPTQKEKLFNLIEKYSNKIEYKAIIDELKSILKID